MSCHSASRKSAFKAGDTPLPGVPWVLDELLGVGGFGEVWKARHPTQHALTVALKFCLDEQAAKSLRREARSLDRVMVEAKGCDGIVKLRQYYPNSDPLCLEYEYVEGGDLGALILDLHRGGGVTADNAVRWMLHLAATVTFAHRLKPALVHRDLKPANILVSRDAKGNPLLRVTDFGISDVAAAHAIEATVPGSGSRGATILRGAYTPLYASPEQIEAKDADPRDDVHALGVIWYQMLTGDMGMTRLPADWLLELRQLKVPEPHIELLTRCLAGKAAKRPDDASDLSRKLQALLGGTTKPAPVAVEPEEDDLVSQWTSGTQQTTSTIEAARHKEKAYRYAEALELLRQAPKHWRDAAWEKSLAERANRVKQLDEQIRERVKALQHRGLRWRIEALLELDPTRESLRKILATLPEESRAFTNSIGMAFALVPKGRFKMGSPSAEQNRGNDEDQFDVQITQPFFMGVHQVTQEAFQRIMNANPSNFCATGGGKDTVKGMDTRRFPVEQATWDEAVEFCRRLSALPEEIEEGRLYRLPTEAEWEYSCRGGPVSYSIFHFGNSLSSAQANFDGRNPYGGAKAGPYLQRPTPVGTFPANSLGLFDMHGNVWEWCADWYGAYPTEGGVIVDYQGPSSGDRRVLRGGAWYSVGQYCRSAQRSTSTPAPATSSTGSASSA